VAERHGRRPAGVGRAEVGGGRDGRLVVLAERAAGVTAAAWGARDRPVGP